MVDLRILKKHGCTKQRLREIFTCTGEDKENHKIKKRICDRINGRISEGLHTSVRHSKFYQAVDLAWDSTPINPETVPLMLYAQGKISMKDCAGTLNKLKCAEDFCSFDEKGDIKGVDIPRLYEISVNLVRSYITRRVAAQSSRFTNLYPFFKYEPRGASMSEKLRAEVLTERVEMITDQYGYRHFNTQAIRDMFLYSKSVGFVASSWEQEKQWRYKRVNGDFVTDAENEREFEAHVVKEGIDFINPHPTRVFYDKSQPMSKINTDTGPCYVGFWDVSRYGSVYDDSAYFNRDKISYSTGFNEILLEYSSFFNYYFDPCVLKSKSVGAVSQPMANDRSANVGVYAEADKDYAVLLTNYYEKINPKEEGIGDYPFEVWVRYVVASDDTVVYAEFLPSIPAVYGAINENDSRLVNVSMAHELMGFQDQLTNILSQLMKDMKSGMIQLWMINKDIFDKDTQEYFKRTIKSGEYYKEPKAFLYSPEKMKNLGIDMNDAVRIIETQISTKVNDAFKAILQLLNLVDRLMILSPQELGQPAPREISASEVVEIANSTNSIYSFISDGVDEMRAAMKKLIYETLISGVTEHFAVPSLKKFAPSTVEAAGFTDDGNVLVGFTDDLVAEYNFSSRDGAERTNNVQVAQTLSTLLGQLFPIPEFRAALGRERFFEVMNEIFLKSGANYALKFDPTEDEVNAPFGDEGAMEQMADILTQLADRVEGIEAVLSGVGDQGDRAPAAQAQPPVPPTGVPEVPEGGIIPEINPTQL